MLTSSELSVSYIPWSRITRANRIRMKKLERLWELPKGDRDTKWADAVGEILAVGEIAPILAPHGAATNL